MRFRTWTLAAAVLAAAFLLALLPLPPLPIDLRSATAVSPASRSAVVGGALHVHSSRSDGSGSPDEIAAAAARAGLDFVILTDHGDGTRPPESPRYAGGVLIIDAVELSTSDGHYIAIGIPQMPYPLRGDARDVAADVRRFGGFGIVAHPDSAKPALRWRNWEAPIDAVEWLNADTEWRDETGMHLLRALIRYPFRPAGTLGSLLDRPETTLGRWDSLIQTRPIVAVAGADAHARAGWNEDDEHGYRREWFLRIPSYESSFRTFANRVLLPAPPTGNAATDARAIVDALKRGSVFTVIDAVASPGILEFSAESGGQRASQGELLDTSRAPVTLIVRINVTAAGVALLKNGEVLVRGRGPELRHEESGEVTGTYRVEVMLENAPGNPPVPFMLSNPIYVRSAEWGSRLPQASPPAIDTRSIQGGPWHSERDGTSLARMTHADPPGGPVEFSYRLGAGAGQGPYAALVIGVGTGLAGNTRLAFRGRASQPTRLSLQARAPQTGARWQRSVYLDAEPRDVIVPFADMAAIDTTDTFSPQRADTVLFVIDTNNAKQGAEGRVTIENLRVER